MKNFLVNNLFSNIINGQLTKKLSIIQQKTNINLMFLNILWDEGFILGYSIKTNKLKIFLKYKNNKPVIESIKLISKPGNKIYFNLKQIWKINKVKGTIIISTNKGLMTIQKCKKLKIGGKPYIIIN